MSARQPGGGPTADTSRRRRGPAGPGRTGRRPGVGDTRARILEAARACFGNQGFDGATIREIAARAGVDPALVHHYFRTKQRLFLTAMQLPVDVHAVAPRLLAGDPDRLGERIVAFVLDLWDTPSTRPIMLGLIRSAADPVAVDLLRSLLVEGPFAALVEATDRGDAELRATLVGSQVVGLAMARYVVGVEPLASAPREAVVAAVGPTIQGYLVGDLTPADRAAGGT